MMKKIAYFLVLLPLIAFQCSKDDTETKPDCGCEGTKVEEYLNDAAGMLKRYNRFYIEYYTTFPEDENNAAIFFPCDSTWFADEKYKEGSRIHFTGEVKPNCPNPGKLGGRPIVLRKVELL